MQGQWFRQGTFTWGGEKEQEEGEPVGLGLLHRTCLASTYSGARMREQLVRPNSRGGAVCYQQLEKAEASVCRGDGRARCSAAKWDA
jgi:hypothetical protein